MALHKLQCERSEQVVAVGLLLSVLFYLQKDRGLLRIPSIKERILNR